MLLENKITKINVWVVKPEDEPLANAIDMDTTEDPKKAIVEIYKKLRPGDMVTVESAKNLVIPMFTYPQRYDLANVGRYKINKRLKLDLPDTQIILTKEDIVATIKYMSKLMRGEGTTDDIDNLSNRRVRGVGELLSIQIKGGIIKMTKMVREK